MLVLVSPAKTLDYESDLNFKDFSIAQHLADSEILIRELQTKNPDDLSSLMGLSEKLSSLNFENVFSFSRSLTLITLTPNRYCWKTIRR